MAFGSNSQRTAAFFLPPENEIVKNLTMVVWVGKFSSGGFKIEKTLVNFFKNRDPF